MYFQVRGDVGSTLSGSVDKLFYVDQFPDFSAIVSVASDDMKKEVSFCFLCIHLMGNYKEDLLFMV